MKQTFKNCILSHVLNTNTCCQACITHFRGMSGCKKPKFACHDHVVFLKDSNGHVSYTVTVQPCCYLNMDKNAPFDV